MLESKKLKIKPNLIIAGTVKGGTTSLFSYLSKHPEICASKVKETCFFLAIRYKKKRGNLAEYAKFFDHCSNDLPYIMESTPGYLDGGKDVALDIKKALGNPKVIFVLRDPVDRLVSFFRYHKAQMNLQKDMRFGEYIRMCKEMPLEQRKQQENDAFWGIDGGMYINYLPEWFEVFGKENIRVLFFDNLAFSPAKVTCSIAEWLDIDSKPFEEAGYGVENRTVPYRFGWAHRYAITLNGVLEPYLRRVPQLKKIIRFFYYMVNSGANDNSVTVEDRLAVAQLYSKKNMILADFLNLNGYKDLPVWLKGKE